MKKSIEEIAKTNGRFRPEAISFVYESLAYTVKQLTDQSKDDPDEVTPRHITGAQLCEGIRCCAIEKWGRLAKIVLNNWDIKTTRDFGEIVYLMISEKWMSAQQQDTIDDFNDIYNFKAAFEEDFKFEMPNN